MPLTPLTPLTSIDKQPGVLIPRIRNPGLAKLENVEVIYVWEAPNTEVRLKEELRVITSFVEAWLANKAENLLEFSDATRPKRLPITPERSTAPPPLSFILVTCQTHRSTYEKSKDQRAHMTIQLCNAQLWTERRSGPCVHVFFETEEPSSGYLDYLVHKKNSSEMTESFFSRVSEARQRILGTWDAQSLALE